MDATVAAPAAGPILSAPMQPIGSLIDQFYDLRERKRELARELKEVEEQMADLEERVINAMDAQETDLSRGRRAKASISESEVPVVEDWDEFWIYVKQSDAPHMFERRPSVSAWRELREQGEEVPGTRPFKKRSLSVRKI